MLKVYGSPLCPDCAATEAYLKAHGMSYEYINITESTSNLKEFLRIRDTQTEVFRQVKAAGNIGIPCFVLETGEVCLEYGDIS